MKESDDGEHDFDCSHYGRQMCHWTEETSLDPLSEVTHSSMDL